MLVILSTADAGETWSVAATDPENQGPVAFVNAADWLEVTGASVRETTDAGASWSERPMASVAGVIRAVSMPDREDGWAVVEDAACQSSDCSENSLVATTDGWRTSHTLTLPNGNAQP